MVFLEWGENKTGWVFADTQPVFQRMESFLLLPVSLHSFPTLIASVRKDLTMDKNSDVICFISPKSIFSKLISLVNWAKFHFFCSPFVIIFCHNPGKNCGPNDFCRFRDCPLSNSRFLNPPPFYFAGFSVRNTDRIFFVLLHCNYSFFPPMGIVLVFSILQTTF